MCVGSWTDVSTSPAALYLSPLLLWCQNCLRREILLRLLASQAPGGSKYTIKVQSQRENISWLVLCLLWLLLFILSLLLRWESSKMYHHVPVFNCSSFFLLGLQSFAGSHRPFPLPPGKTWHLLSPTAWDEARSWKEPYAIVPGLETLQKIIALLASAWTRSLLLGVENTVAVVSLSTLKFSNLV